MPTLTDHLAHRIRLARARLAGSIALAFLIGLLLVTAWAGAVLAAFLWLLALLGPVLAALSISAVMLVAAGIVLAIVGVRRRREKRRRQTAAATAAASLLPALLPLLARRGPVLGFAAAAFIAYLAVRSAGTEE